MYNEDIPTRAELPTSRQLIRSSIIAFVSAIAILATVILPAEYAIDPTGIGGALGLGEMGEIKMQLAQEAEQDRLKGQQNQPSPQSEQKIEPKQQSNLFDSAIAFLFVSSAVAQSAISDWRDEISISLAPGQGAEVKLVMKEGANAQFSWKVEGGKANFDLHGDGGGKSISYEKGRGVPEDEGTLKASFDGNHGWFWRNRGKQDITVILKVKGDYVEMKRVI
tara:strand:+ start:35959 stop:36624 length:666 start_codon:yes stop_codon:yes gene_type:complete